ncbi:hypothetical protein ACTXPS_19195 [Brachybacterium tyrofermentans]|uniref:hypothetical protein n=1 Tax=Brachybacterium tyrofermentans TaxID=47848 RepID=UPI003FD476E9
MSDSRDLPGTRRGGVQPLAVFCSDLGLPADFSARAGGEDDRRLAEAVEWMRVSRPPKQNFWPALCLALIAQCEATLAAAQQESDEDPFSNFPIESTSGSSGRIVNTLNFQVGGTKVTLRPQFNRALQVIRVDMRRDHPSAAAHATQAWTGYRPLIVKIFQMTAAARTRFAEYVWDKGVLQAPERRWAEQAERIVRPFEKVLADFSTQSAPPGGALFQALVFGYFRADSPNLTLESHQVNTGSSRVDMPGDVAGFRGGEVELAVEVKDHAISVDTVESVLVDFLEDLNEAPNTTAVVVADEVDDASRARLAESNVIALSRAELRERVAIWDLPKQQEALRGAIYYLSRIQKRTQLVEKLVGFLNEHEIASGILDQPILKVEGPDVGPTQSSDTSVSVRTVN